MKTERGFTLIELLIVMVIISILIGFLTVNYVGVRQRARDGVRKSDLRKIQMVLEMYREDQNSYPDSIYSGNCTNSQIVFDPGGGAPSIVYQSEVPCDPFWTSTATGLWNNGRYYYSYTFPRYTLAACLENTEDSDRETLSSGSTDPIYSVLEGLAGGACASHKYTVFRSP